MARFGARKKPTYRVVVIEKEKARDSSFIEIVGHYNPRTDPAEVVLKHDRIQYWMGVGAQPSDTVKRLLKTSPAPAGDAVEAPAS
jgi:small subunit ribosomal protein S16